MPRYGGGKESFEEQQARLAQMEARLASIEGKEVAVTAATQDLGAATDAATTKRQTFNKAKSEGTDITAREVAVQNQETAALDVNTAAIEKNRLAREKRAQAELRASINSQRAFRGAGDPLFAAASASGVTSQYGLRREFGIGGGRADKLREAIRAPFITPATTAGVAGAQTRVQAAESDLVRADIALSAAKRHYTASVKRGDQAAAEEARELQKHATAAHRAATLELESAEKMAASANEVVAARQAAAVAAAREDELRRVHGGTRGELIVRDPHGALGASGMLPNPQQPYHGVRTTKEGVEPGIAESMAARKASNELVAAQQAAASSSAAATAQQVHDQETLAKSRLAADEAGQQIAARSAARAGALRAEGVALSTVSQAMHKHGALTQEFILAAARGETTLRELGNQALVTAGKFGGWTAAATGLFAVAGAIQQVGHGAIVASGGVHTLDRVLDRNSYSSDEAQQAFADLAREFNVPMDVAVDAVYRMGQRFHDFPSAVNAARASLYSFKTGEVDVATSTENLLAIVNGFGLSSKDLTTVYDQINQAQNTFGIRIRDTEAGLAKAAGTYRNAGGDLNYLLALTTAIGRATNRSGQEIGTGIARGVNEIRKSVNQAKLEAQGVDVIPENFQKTLQNALKVADQNPHADLQQIASGLFGNQYARLIAPVLRDQKVLNDALRDTSPEASKASAQKELAKVLEQADERIKSVGIELQNLGAALNRAGAFNLAGLLLDGLVDVLSMAVRIVEVFDKLPEPIRDAATIAAELAVTMKLLQRFGATERLAGGPLGFLAAPDRQFAARAKSGLRGARDAARDEQERTGMRAYRTESAAARAQLMAVEADSAAQAARKAGNVELEIIANQKAADANALAARLAAESATAAEEAAAARLLAAAADEEYVAAAKMDTKTLAATARANMVPVPAAFPPNSQGLQGSAEHAAWQAAAANRAAVSTRQLSRFGQAAEDGLTRYYASLGAGLQAVTRDQVRLGTIGRGLDKGAGLTIRAAGRATTVVENAAHRLVGVGGGLRRFAASLGPLDIAFGAFFVLEAIGSDMKEQQDKLQQQAKSVFKTPQTAAGMKQYRQQLKDQISGGPSLEGEFFEDWRARLNPINLFSEITGIGGYQSPSEQRRTQVEDPARAALEEQNRIREEQKRRSAQGLAVANLTYDQLSKRVDRDQELRKAGIISQREFDHRMENHAKEATLLYFPTAATVEKAAALIADARRSDGGENYTKALRGLSTANLAQQVQAIGTQIKDFGATGGDLRRLAQVYSVQVEKLSGKSGAEDIKALSEARSTYFSIVTDAAKYELDAALADATTEAGRRRAFAAASRATRSGLVGRARQQLQDTKERLALARRRANEARSAFSAGATHANLGQLPGQDSDIDPFGLTYTPDGALAELRDQALKTAKRVRKLMQNRTKTNKELQAAIKADTDAQRVLREAAAQDAAQGRQIDLALAQSRTSDPGVAASLAAQAAVRELAIARASKGPNRMRNIKIALTNVNNANKESADVVKQQAEDAKQRAEEAARTARELRDARFDYLGSLTTDPVAQAHIETLKAHSHIKGSTGAERLSAKAEFNRARQAERDAKLQSREEDIEFERDMGKLSVDDAISRYRQLLQIRNLTKAQKRDIRRKIHELQQEGESEASGFDLDVGSIRLPTMYDVRKAWDPIRDARRESVHALKAGDVRNNVSHMYHSRAQVQANIRVVVNDKNAAGEVFSAIDRALKTTVRAQMRSHGMRG